MLLEVRCYDENEQLIFSTLFRELREARKFFIQMYDTGLYNHVSLVVIDEDCDE